MKLRDLIMCLLQSMGGRIDGRTRLQKLAYFCKVCGLPIDANFRLYLKGPTSPEVTAALEDATMDGILWESRGYIFRDKELAEKRTLREREQRILNDVIRIFGGMPIEQLEILATMFFVCRQQKSLSGDVSRKTLVNKAGYVLAGRLTENEIEHYFGVMTEVCFSLAERYQ